MMRTTFLDAGGSGMGVVGVSSCKGMQVPCDQVANEGRRRTGSAHSFLGNGRHDNRTCRMILSKQCIRGEGGKVPGGWRIHQGNGWC